MGIAGRMTRVFRITKIVFTVTVTVTVTLNVTVIAATVGK